MADPSDWLPAFCHIRDHGNDWATYLEALYSLFRRDFIESKPVFNGLPVACRRDPIYDGKEAGFWHCMSEGAVEAEREPDFSRCERLAWIRAVLENAYDTRVEQWKNNNRGDWRTYLWFKEEYLIVLGSRKQYWQLITAFCTPQEHSKRKLRRERDESLANG